MPPKKQTVRLCDIFVSPPNYDVSVDLQVLADHIREHGLLEPLLVTTTDKYPGFQYELLRGTRRYEAMKTLGITECKCLIF